MEKFFEKNYEYWKNNKERNNFSDYQINNIFDKNPNYNRNFLINCNKYFMTYKSQQNESNDINESIDQNICKYFSENHSFNYNDLLNCKIIRSIQRPYIDSITTKTNGYILYNNLYYSQNICAIIYNIDTILYNPITQLLLDSDKILFNKKKEIILSYDVIDKEIKYNKVFCCNRTSYKTKYLIPLKCNINDKYNDFYTNIPFSLKKYHNILCGILLIGIDEDVDINHIFTHLHTL